MDKRKKRLIIIICAAAALIIFLLAGIAGCVNKKGSGTRTNVCNLARTYAERGEYDRALNKLDDYLEKHGDDDEVWALWNSILDMKKEAAENGGNTTNLYDGNSTNNQNSSLIPDNLKIDLDTSGISSAMQDSLSSMQSALEESNKQAEENRRAMESLMKMQENQKLAEEKRIAEQQAEAAQKKAEEEAAAEQKRKQEEKRKAEEEALAKKNAELKKQIDAVNSEIQQGQTALAMGNIEEAMKHFNMADSIIPSGAGKSFQSSKESEVSQSLYDAAQKATDPEKKAQLMNNAVSMARKAIESDPKDAGAHYIIAQNALDNKDYDTALKEMKAAVEYDPNNYLYWYNLGKIQYTLGKYSEAASSFTKSCDLKSDFAPSRYNLGLTQKKLKNDTAALAAFRKTIDIDNRHEKAYLEEARILSDRGDYSGAIDAYKSVLKINNINVQAAMELGSVYRQAGKYEEAEESYKRALTMLSPGETMTNTKYNLSNVMFDAGKVADAEKYAREAYEGKDYLKNDNSKANIVYNYALILDNQGKTDDAIPLYLEVLKLVPDHIKTKINLGVMYLELDPPVVDTAISLFTQVYNKDSKNIEANNNLGKAYLLKEDYANAIKFYQNALTLDSKNNAIRANLAKAYAQAGEYDYAKSTYTDLLKTDKENWDAYIELAKVCMQVNDNANAEKYLIFVQEKNPSYKAKEVAGLLSSLN
ncbi:MAG: tetratricopeptide repeat protein [Treponema sp.]|nr:tetratricopeptide repeat protein [Treponema sp.]